MVDGNQKILKCVREADCGSFPYPWGCDTLTGLKIRDGFNLCVKIDPISNTLGLMALKAGPTPEERRPFLPVFENVDEFEIHSDCKNYWGKCNFDQFCDVILTYPEGRIYPYRRCFHVPKLPNSNEGPTIPIVVELAQNLLPCSKNEECECPDCKKTEILRCDLETGWSFRKHDTPHNGICVKANPVAFTFSETYMNLLSSVVYEERRRYFPAGQFSMLKCVEILFSDYTGPEQNFNDMKVCSSNKDCAADQFCDEVLDYPSNRPKAGRSHCFSIPIDAVFRETTKAIIAPDVSGLTLCNVASNCPSDSFCGRLTGWQFRKWDAAKNETTSYKGFCMKAAKCTVNEFNEPFKWEFGSSPNDEKFSCDSDEDCARTRDTSDTIYQSSCALKNILENVNLCCHREVKPCKYGIVSRAGMRCQKNVTTALFSQGGFAECNGGLEKMREQDWPSSKWCDEENHQCCQTPTSIQYCPDEQTPLFNEPKCQNGECVGVAGSMCKLGHCCPDVRLDSHGQIIRNKYSYKTNHPCQPGIRPPSLPGGYCEPESGKVVIHGELSLRNEPFRETGFFVHEKCFDDSDCSADNSTICIYENEWISYCFYNPSRELPLNPIWIVVIVVVIIVILLVGIIIGITLWVIRMNRRIKAPLENGSHQATSTLSTSPGTTKTSTPK